MSCDTLIKLIYTIILSGSIVFTAIWAVYKYLRRNELASLQVVISKVELISKPLTENNYLLVEIYLKNSGTREVQLYYDYTPNNEYKRKFEKLDKNYKAQLKIFKLNENDEKIEIHNKIGLDSETKTYTGRLRTGAELRMPFLATINESGIYFIEFSIDINMRKFYKGKDYKDDPIKRWSDRQYHRITI